MYTRFYKFSQKPFSSVSDGFCFFKNSQFGEAYNHVLYAIREKEGFVLITGEAGTGKTTLCRAVLKRLGDRACGAIISQPLSTGHELLSAVHEAFGLQPDGTGRTKMHDTLRRFFMKCRESGKAAVLVIDEAQLLNHEVLEEIRCLSNAESCSEKLLQIILCGQPPLLDYIARPEMSQLFQRIGIHYCLKPLSGHDVFAYIKYRIMSAGTKPTVRFTEEAAGAVARYSKGVPRIINQLCDKSLLAGYVEQQHIITGTMVDEAAKNICFLRSGKKRVSKTIYTLGAGAAALAAVALLIGSAPVLVTKCINAFKQTARSDIGYAMVKAPDRMHLTAENRHSKKMSGTKVQPAGTPIIESSVVPNKNIVKRAHKRSADTAKTSGAHNVTSSTSSGLHHFAGCWFDRNNIVRTEQDVQCAHEALGTVLYLWGVTEKEVAEYVAVWKRLNKFSFYDAAGACGFTVCTQLSDMETIAALNYPCIVPIRDGRYRYAVLGELGEQSVTLLDPSCGMRTIAHDKFQSLWTGRVFYVWKDKADFPLALKPGDRHETVLRLKENFIAAGFFFEKPYTTLYDKPLTDAVKRLQRKASIEADGIFGGMTKMAYYRFIMDSKLPSIVRTIDSNIQCADSSSETASVDTLPLCIEHGIMKADMRGGRCEREALVTLLNLWDVSELDLVRVAESFEPGDTFTQHASRCGFSITRKNITFNTLKIIDYPCIAAINDPSLRFVVVKSITASAITLLDPLSGERVLTKESFMRIWENNVFYAWKNIDGIPLGLKKGIEHSSLPDLRHRLSQAGIHVSGDDSLHFGSSIETAVKAFQKRNNLVPDGIIGSRTLMTLYKRMYPGRIPSLKSMNL